MWKKNQFDWEPITGGSASGKLTRGITLNIHSQPETGNELQPETGNELLRLMQMWKKNQFDWFPVSDWEPITGGSASGKLTRGRAS